MRVYYLEQPDEFVLMDAAVLTEMLDQIKITRKQINGLLDIIQSKVENALQGKRVAGKALSDLAAAIDSADVIQENVENVLHVERIDHKALSDLAAAIKAHQYIIDRHVPDPRECELKEYSGAINENGEKIYGIDLGTTYSSIAFTNESGIPETITNREGLKTTPSVVCFETEGMEPIVGERAKDMIGDEDCGDRVIDSVKKQMGEVLRDENNEPLKDENWREIKWETKEVFGKKYLPEYISAFILRKMVDDANDAYGHDVKKVVITCPAYFNAAQREATKRSGMIAGLEVIDIIEEPVAAALFYGLANNPEDPNKDVIVYDLGGGTCDVTVLHVEHGRFTVKCTYGDHNLGGKNWDNALVSLIVQKVKESASLEENPLDDADFSRYVHAIAEKLKIKLSETEVAKFKLLYNGKRVNGSITRDEFESATSGLLSSTQCITQLVIEDAAKKGITQFDEFLLVGGSTKMPQVKRMVDAEFSKYCKKISFTPDADEAVAKGAALGAVKAV